LDLDEVTKAASAVYDRLEKGNDTTLDRKEAALALVERNFPPPARITTAR